jgi:hypothetical protein
MTRERLMDDPQTAARGMVDRVQHPVLGEICAGPIAALRARKVVT